MIRFKKHSPVLVVEKIEPCLDFWTTLGFNKIVEIPEGDELGFVILESDGMEIMYQSIKSVEKDLPKVANYGTSKTFLYIECTGLNEIIEKVPKEMTLVGPRETFYGAREIVTREPGGNIIGFAEKIIK